jgi:hypothetical protein
MKICPWEGVVDFQSLNEFNRFVDWMGEQVRSGLAEEAPVRTPYIGATAFRERCFRHLESGQTWRLVWPDAPFAGVFEKIV